MHTLLELASGSCKLWHGVSGEALVFCVMCCGLLFRFSRGYHKCSCPVSLKKNSKKPVVLVASHGFPLHFVSGGGAARYARTDLKRDSRVM
jgi:hypothetical protein